MAEVILSVESQSQFEELPGKIQVRVRSVFERLRKYPRISGAKALRGDLAGQYRVRTGDYRVQFYHSRAIDTVCVTKVGHRDGFYE